LHRFHHEHLFAVNPEIEQLFVQAHTLGIRCDNQAGGFT
jgi:hypothetical protein